MIFTGNCKKSLEKRGESKKQLCGRVAEERREGNHNKFDEKSLFVRQILSLKSNL